MHKKTSYLEVATMAARQETEGCYARAATLWETAQDLAKNATNEAWCQNRAELCERKRASLASP
ncbi:TPA: ANR family transcriptional regulator [Enterobacter ludwigii]|nr:ANR family transcriptional regulator [Enterobacter ludwigii]HDR2600272.1 ANR family transcriptional regulator [Enterobacter ludwigii]